MPALLPEPRGGRADGHWGTESPGSGQSSRQPRAWRQRPGEAAPEPPETGHSASSEGSSPPLLPSRPFSRGGKEGSRAPSPRRAAGLPTVLLERAGLAPSPGPGRQSPRRAGATRPASSSFGVSAPASARSSFSRLRGLTLSPTRRAENQEAAAATAASRAGAARRRAPSSQKPCAGCHAFRTPGAWRPAGSRALRGGYRGVRGGRGPCSPPTPGAVPAPSARRSPLLAAGLGVRFGLEGALRGWTKRKDSRPTASKHLRRGRQPGRAPAGRVDAEDQQQGAPTSHPKGWPGDPA